jgi:hypothetical protein
MLHHFQLTKRVVKIRETSSPILNLAFLRASGLVNFAPWARSSTVAGVPDILHTKISQYWMERGGLGEQQ